MTAMLAEHPPRRLAGLAWEGTYAEAAAGAQQHEEAEPVEEERPAPAFAPPAPRFDALVEEDDAPSAEAWADDDASIEAAPPAEARPAPLPLPTHGLSIAELTDRLERGLASRRRMAGANVAPVLADMPVAPAVPVRQRVAPDAAEALRAALGTLRTMAARRR